VHPVYDRDVVPAGSTVALVAMLTVSGCGRMGYGPVEKDEGSGGDVDAAVGAGPEPDGGGLDVGLDGGLDAGFDDAVPEADAGASSVVADTYLHGLDPMPNGANPDMRCGREVGGALMFPLVRFDVSEVPSDATIASATLRLYQFAHNGTGTMTVNVRRVTQEWDEATADWFNADSTTPWTSGGGGSYDSAIEASASVPNGAYGTYDWDVTSLVQRWVAGTAPNHGVQLTFATVSPGTWVTFATRENTAESQRPALIIAW
jgi:hypothetical protein